MKRPRAYTEFKNIRVLPSGYQVSITRATIEFSRHFAGHSEASHRAAIRFRDKLLGELPPKRLNPIPKRVLAAVGLDKEAVGVSRHASRTMYQVGFRIKGEHRNRSFSWGNELTEIEAYAAAVAFRSRAIGYRPAKREKETAKKGPPRSRRG